MSVAWITAESGQIYAHHGEHVAVKKNPKNIKLWEDFRLSNLESHLVQWTELMHQKTFVYFKTATSNE